MGINRDQHSHYTQVIVPVLRIKQLLKPYHTVIISGIIMVEGYFHTKEASERYYLHTDVSSSSTKDRKKAAVDPSHTIKASTIDKGCCP